VSAGLGDGLLAIGALRHDLDVALRAEEHGDSGSYQGLIVGKQLTSERK
jgi:hypothetical protein